MPRTTAYRLLATLVARGLLRRDPVRRVYCLGMRCFEMARQAYAMPDLAAAAALELRALRDLTGETSYLAALDGREVVSLERCDGAHSERSSSALGQRKPVHCTSQGKAILSALPAADRETLLRGLSLKAVTPRTITDRRRLQAELRVTAARGYAIDDEEIVPGVRCVGAPIVDAQGEVHGALSVAGPAWRLTPERLELLGPELAEAARRVGAQLGRTRAPVADTMACALAGPWAFHGAHPHWCAEANLLYWADSLAPALRAWSPQAAPDGEPREAGAAPLPAGTDQALAECDEPIAGVLVHGPQDVSLAGARGAVRWRPGAAQPEPWPAWPDGAAVRAACLGGADADGESVWIAMETAGGGSAVGRLQAAGNVEVLWRLAEALQCLRWRAGDGALLATVPDTGAILHMHPRQPGRGAEAGHRAQGLGARERARLRRRGRRMDRAARWLERGALSAGRRAGSRRRAAGTVSDRCGHRRRGRPYALRDDGTPAGGAGPAGECAAVWPSLRASALIRPLVRAFFATRCAFLMERTYLKNSKSSRVVQVLPV